MIFFAACQLILLDVLPKGSQFNQQCFIDYVFSDSKTENRNFCHRIPLATFWVHMNNSMCHNVSEIVSKFDKHYIAQSPHPPYSRTERGSATRVVATREAVKLVKANCNGLRAGPPIKN
jgi:hypothetical protein